ncbi:MAG: hypothetical protein LBK73_05225 [Treponema sp.]|jgi:hypothetical protein|nr:hypothetical protein [Treponema sp.]
MRGEGEGGYDGKQMAAQEDAAMGFDVHKMVVTDGEGTEVVPLPRPYIGSWRRI